MALQIDTVLNAQVVSSLVPPGMTALKFLREVCGLTGTKEGCGEGDCGACTIAVGERKNGRVVYRAVNSCLCPASRLHGKHVVTVEGLADGPNLHPIQKAVLEHHATQCGFCTPGVVMSLFCLFSEKPKPADSEIRDALEGNLCRCTGYASILETAKAVKGPAVPPHLEKAAALVGSAGASRVKGSFSIEALAETLRANGDDGPETILSGGTDLMVGVNVLGRRLGRVVDLSRFYDLSFVREKSGRLSIGGLATFADLSENPQVKERLRALHAASSMGSAQVRNVATLAGNIANASPVGDGTVAVLALGAGLSLRSAAGTRALPLEEFFLGYKKTALGDREIIESIDVPLGWTHSSFVKTTKREAVDIATVSSAVALKIEGGKVAAARVSLGGVAPYAILANTAAEVLVGKKPSEAVFEEAGEVAMSEVTPISDVRGSAEYRRLLVRNHLLINWRTMFGEKP